MESAAAVIRVAGPSEPISGTLYGFRCCGVGFQDSLPRFLPTRARKPGQKLRVVRAKQFDSKDKSMVSSPFGESLANSVEVKQWESGYSFNDIAASQGIKIRRRPPTGPPQHYVGPFEFRLENEGNTPRNILEKIIWYKDNEVQQLKQRNPLARLKGAIPDAPPARDFIGALRAAYDKIGMPALIAEVKKASPSRGVLREDFDPIWWLASAINRVLCGFTPIMNSLKVVKYQSCHWVVERDWHLLSREKKQVKCLDREKFKHFYFLVLWVTCRTFLCQVQIANAYEAGGAACLSVLTDQKFFQGSFENLEAIRNSGIKCPLLCKEFIIEAWQIYYARCKGADAILLIAAVLPDLDIKYMTKICKILGMTALVEVHNEREMDRVLGIDGIQLIGINNRNLETFEVDISNTKKLLEGEHGETIRQRDIIVVGESGLFTPQDIAYVQAAGVKAVLVGESLVKQDDPREGIASLYGKEISA